MVSISDLIEREHGTRNWVLARRTPRIIERYGDDVVCLSQKRYNELSDLAEFESAGEHPAAPIIGKLIASMTPPADFIRALRASGYRIEKVPGVWAGRKPSR